MPFLKSNVSRFSYICFHFTMKLKCIIFLLNIILHYFMNFIKFWICI